MDSVKQFNRQALIKNILSQKWPSQKYSVFYVNIYKESETGILFNERMLVLEDQKFTVFYTKYFKPLSLLMEMQNKGTNSIKERLFILNTTITKDNNTVNLHFNSNNNKTTWLFKFNNPQLADKWIYLFHQLQEKCISKSIKTKQTKSTYNVSDYASILTNTKYIDKVKQEDLHFIEGGKQEEDAQYSTKKKKIEIKKLGQA